MTKTSDTIGPQHYSDINWPDFRWGWVIGFLSAMFVYFLCQGAASRPHYSEVEELREDNKVLRMQRAVLLELGNRAVKQTEEALALCAPEEK